MRTTYLCSVHSVVVVYLVFGPDVRGEAGGVHEHVPAPRALLRLPVYRINCQRKEFLILEIELQNTDPLMIFLINQKTRESIILAFRLFRRR